MKQIYEGKLQSRLLKTLFTILIVVLPGLGFGQVSISAGSAITQDFNTIGNTTTAGLPAGWKADAQGSARTLGTYAGAGTATTRSGAANISDGAFSGIYNFGAGSDNNGSDRAIGGLSAGSSNRTINIYLDMLNTGAASISSLNISYNVEKYRNGSNARGFSMQMYFSTDGTSWTSAGANFLTSYPADALTGGATPVPIASAAITSQNLALPVALSQNSHLYLAWSYSVTDNADGSNAQALGIDDVNIQAVPTLVTDKAALAFGNVPLNTSSVQSFTVGGINLTSNVTITPPSATYKIRTGSNSFSNIDLVLTPVNGTLANTTIDVEFTPTVAQSYPGTISITSSGATSGSITLSGTGIPVSTPSLTTTAVSGLSLTAAVSGGNITSDGGNTVQTRGIVWSTTTNPTIALTTKTAENTTSTGTFSHALSGLSPQTRYYVRAYATNGLGTSYGNEVSFTTLKEAPLNQATNITLSNIKARTMTISWTSGNGDRRVVKMNTSNSFTAPADGTSPGTSTTYTGGEQVIFNGFGNTVTVKGLSENTTYWFRVYEYNNQGTDYTTYNTATALNNPLSQQTTNLQVAPQLIISQVYEGLNSNKWIELTNIGSTTINLAALDLSLGMYSITGDAGSGAISGSPSSTFELSGTLNPDSSLLIRHSSADFPVYALSKPGTLSNGGVNAFNGNDALALLINSSDIVDAFGTGINNKDVSYYRKRTVTVPNTTFTESEWEPISLALVDGAPVYKTERLGIHGSPNNPLPVTLISFQAKVVSNKVLLTWATAAELNNNRFEVQRSSNGESFQTFTTVAGYGTSNQVTHYQATDEQTLTATAYYRLKQVDMDGKTSYSKIVAVNGKSEKAAVSVYPNPAGNNLTIVFAGEARSVSVLNMLGQEVMKQQLIGSKNRSELNIAALPAGAYQVVVATETGQSVQKFVKVAK